MSTPEAPLPAPRAPAAPLPWLVLALVAGSALTFLPLAAPTVLAAWVAIISRPLLDRFARALKGRSTAAAVLTVLLLVLLAVPLGVIVAGVLSGISQLAELIGASEGAPSALKALVSDEPAPGASFELPTTSDLWFAWAQRHIGQLYQLLGGIAGTAIRVGFGLLVFFLGVWTFLLEGPAIRAWYDANVPLPGAARSRLAAAFVETGRGLLIGVGLTTASQAVAATIIYLALGVPRGLMLGLLTGLATFIPVVGAALIWLPVAAGLYLTDHPAKAVIMVALGMGIISSMDNVLRPIFSRFGKLDLPVFLLVIAVLGGLMLFGPLGALLGPLVVRLAKEGLALLREERDAAKGLMPPPPSPR